MEIKNLAQFDNDVLKSDVPVLVDFWAEWCPPCRMYSPVIESVAEELKDKVKLAKINVDENEELASKYNIASIPTTFLVQDGKIKASFVGALNKDALMKWLKDNL